MRGVQNLRKERGLEVTDRIELTVSGKGDNAAPGLLKAAFDQFSDYLKSETLSVSAVWVDSFDSVGNAQLDAALEVYLQQLDLHGLPTDTGVSWDGLPDSTEVLTPPAWALRDLNNKATEEAAEWLLSDLEGIMS